MPAVKQQPSQVIFFEDFRVETIETVSCFHIRKQLDALFDAESSLEETPAAGRRSLFAHLENCRGCCRAFDARVRFRAANRAPIY